MLRTPKLVSELLSAVQPHSIFRGQSAQALNVTSIEVDSRKVKLGSLFFAVPGAELDGHQFISQAIAKGALGLIVEKTEFVPPEYTGLVVKVDSVRKAVWQMAKIFFDNPTENIFTVGVTGTNGKTSVTYLVEHLFMTQKIPIGVIGTIDHHLHSNSQSLVWPNEGTTPDAISLQSRLSEMKSAGAKVVAMEVTSHALDQYRADGVEFDVVVFTNLTRDHLDYHKTMENYFNSKARLFSEVLAETKKQFAFSIINGDDPWGQKIVTDSKSLIWTFGLNSNCDYKWKVLTQDFQGVTIELETPLALRNLFIPLIGEHNIQNAVAAYMTGVAAQLNEDQMIENFKSFKGIPGRLQKIKNTEKNVFIDYAHTPDALERALKALVDLKVQNNSTAKIWTVFGCGGDRDRGKRPLMGGIAKRLSDFVIVTSDNPRTENPEAIISEIIGHEKISEKFSGIVDRKTAIQHAIQKSQRGDVILIAGKGHEDYQIIGTQKLPFNDFLIAQEYLQ